MRVRFTAKSLSWWKGVLQYAEDTNRTPSELICEALDQIQARYPKRRQATQTDMDAICNEIAKRFSLRYPQVPLKAKGLDT